MACYCHTCERKFHPLGIMRHRAMHRDKKENCKITYTHGDTYNHNYAVKKNEPMRLGGAAGVMVEKLLDRF